MASKAKTPSKAPIPKLPPAAQPVAAAVVKKADEQLAQYDKYVESQRPIRTHLHGVDLSCGAKFSKKALVVMNTVFLIFGIVLISLGAYALNSTSTSIAGDELPAGAVALGVIVMVISMFGCIGAWKESRILLGLFAGVLVIAILIQIIIFSLLLSDKNRANSLITSGWNSASAGGQMDIQNEFSCCGLKVYNMSTSTKPAPQPCPPESIPKQRTCLAGIRSEFNSRIVVLGALGIVMALLEIAGVIMALGLRHAVKDEAYKRHIEEVKRSNRAKV